MEETMADLVIVANPNTEKGGDVP